MIAGLATGSCNGGRRNAIAASVRDDGVKRGTDTGRQVDTYRERDRDRVGDCDKERRKERKVASHKDMERENKVSTGLEWRERLERDWS